MTTRNRKQHTWQLYKEQWDFVKATEKEIMFSGGFGAGKSLTLCLKLLQDAIIPNNFCLLARKTLTDLKDSTLRTLLYGSGKCPPILPKGTYKHDKINSLIHLYNGGTIKYTGIENLKVRSINAGIVAIDEVVELNEDEYISLFSRLRCDVGSRRMIMATNPGSQNHFLYNRFFIDNTEKKRKVITCDSRNNIYNPQDYTDSLNEFTGVRRLKYLEGLWANLDNIIYPTFIKEKNVKHVDATLYKEFVIGVDAGYNHPAALVLMGRDEFNNLHVFDEWREREQLNSQIIKAAKKWIDYTNIISIDPSAASLQAEAESQGFKTEHAKNEVDKGIDLIRDYFGRVKLTISPSCQKLINELENYSYDDNKKVSKENDDLCDSLRYAGLYYLHDLLTPKKLNFAYFPDNPEELD